MNTLSRLTRRAAALLTLSAFLGGAAAPGAPMLVLDILPGGKMRFGKGPEMDMPGFKAALPALAQKDPRPVIALVPHQGVAQDVFIAVMKEIEKAGLRYGFITGPAPQ